MELKTLRYFVAVAEELNFSRAAKRLHISQPPLSRQISKLERELGVLFFQRTTRHVELTPSGRLFLQQVTPILSAVKQAATAARRADRGEIGRLVIGFSLGTTYTLLPQILRRFDIQCPEVELVLQEMEITKVSQALASGDIDVGFLRPPVADSSIRTDVVIRERFVAAIPVGSKFSKKRQLKLIDLAQESFVMFPPGPSVLHSQIMTACGKAGFRPHVVQQARHSETLIGLVRSGAGIALVPSSVQMRGGAGVIFRDIIGPLPMAEIAVAWRRNDSALLLQAFLDTARSVKK